jgi:hypothetical protein
MPLDLAISDEVKQLRRAGLRPNERLAQHILHAGAAAVGPLLGLALETDLLHTDEPECYAPIHALRLLGELHSVEIIAPLLRVFPIEQEYPEEYLPLMWADEASQMIGRLGAAAVEPLWAIVDDTTWDMVGRGVALMALTYATVIAPEIRASVVDGVLERLSRSDDNRMTAHLVSALASLGVGSAYKQIMDLYRQGRVDQEIIAPGQARQLLLAPDATQRLMCVTHPLWERYEKHGPHAEELEA